MSRTLLLGATGYLGRYVAHELARRGHGVRAVVRSQALKQEPAPLGAPSLTPAVSQWVVGDVSRAEVLHGTTEDIDYVVSCLGVTTQQADPWDIDYRANLAALAQAQRTGVKGFCYVNVIGAEACPARLTRAKSAFAQALQRSPVPSQVIDPPGYFSDMMQVLTMVRRTGRMWVLPPGGTARINPIHGADLAVEVVGRLEAGEQGRWAVGGPDVYTWRELGHLAGRTLGRTVRACLAPSWLPGLAARATQPFSSRRADTIRFLSWGMMHDAVGEPVGTHHLADFWADQIAAREHD